MRVLKLALAAALISAAAAPVMLLVAYLFALALEHINRPPEADAVYRVHLEYTVTGTPDQEVEDIVPLEAKVTVPKHGSGSAVSGDGYIVTARHVADIMYDAPEMCAGVLMDSSKKAMTEGQNFSDVRIAWVTLRVTAADGTTWHGYGYAPMDGQAPCDADLVPRIEWHRTSQARIVAMDPQADLTLLKIEARGIPYLKLDESVPNKGERLTALGVVRDVEQVLDGSVLNPCVSRKSTRPEPAPMPALWMSQILRHGMSGGPTVSDDRLLGINVHVERDGSYAVAGPYVAQWYDWVRGRRDGRPLPECPAF